jgi:hypothetical protein
MKTMKKLFLYMMMLAGMTACTNDDNVAQTQQPAAGAKVYQVCIPASIGDGSQTRAIELGTGDKDGYLVSTFKTTDNITAFGTFYGWAYSDFPNKVLACLHPDDNAATANLVGEMAFYDNEGQKKTLVVGHNINLMYNTSGKYIDYSNQNGTLEGLSDLDFAYTNVAIVDVDDDNLKITTTYAHFENAQSMFKFTFTGMDEGDGIESVLISSDYLISQYYANRNDNNNSNDKLGSVSISLDDAVRSTNGPGVVYAALRFFEVDDNFSFLIKGTSGKYYCASKATPSNNLSLGKYYTSTIEVYPQNVNLSTVTQTDGKGVKYYAAQNGQILTGKFSGDGGYITIADGATVTLAGADIQAPYYYSYSPPYFFDHAAIHCLGNANIILDHKAGASGTDDYNRAKAGQFSDWPAVYVPQGKTLTISGTGKLWANGENSSGGAGIGGGKNINCGNITISSGIIPEAKGGTGAAGIGGGDNGSCGNILICGGTIGSYGAADYDGAGAVGGDNAPGIGSLIGDCGNITITDGITYVKVKKSSSAIYFIGGVRCGTVTISGQEMVSERLKSGDNGYIGNLFSICDGKQWELRP